VLTYERLSVAGGSLRVVRLSRALNYGRLNIVAGVSLRVLVL
jgi:hypothetical protein